MLHIPKKVLYDEDHNPVAVLIDYPIWLKVQEEVETLETEPKLVDLSPFVGVLKLTEDPVEFQRRIRDEWE